ncbi:MAG: hypothetical protein ACREXU_11815 [Gammaproteobacteria bacterium]
MSYRLLDTFRATFEGKRYLHRDPSLGDFVAMQLYEDAARPTEQARLQARIESPILFRLRTRDGGIVGRIFPWRK